MGEITKRPKKVAREEMELMGAILKAAEGIEEIAKSLRAALKTNLETGRYRLFEQKINLGT